MKTKIIVAIGGMLVLASCKPTEAIDLRNTISANDEYLKDIILSEGSPEEAKLNCLVNDDFKGALSAIDKQKAQFDSLIQRTSAISVRNVKEGEALKRAAVDYYQALKLLHMADREEVMQQVITHGVDTTKIRLAQDKILELLERKGKLFQQVYDKDEKMRKALDHFNKENGL